MAELIEKRREKIPTACGEPHPTAEWFTIVGVEYVYYAHTCYFGEGHDGQHGYVGPGGATYRWPE